jgi:hypothetical protein
MFKLVMLLFFLGSVTGCVTPCWDWAFEPKAGHEYGGVFKATPLSRGQCQRRAERRKNPPLDSSWCSQLREYYKLDICWGENDWKDFIHEKENNAGIGELPHDRILPSP